MSFFAFSEGPLAGDGVLVRLIRLTDRASLRSAILSLPPSLGRGHIFIVAVTTLPGGIAICLTTILNWLVRNRRYRLVRGLRSCGLWNATAIEVVVGIENLEVVRILWVTFSVLDLTIR
jgi:hypothetical protein